MIGYFFYMGDAINGKNIKKIIFEKIKVITYLQENLNPENYSAVIKKIQLRYMIDGDIKQYSGVKGNKIFYSKKHQCLSADYHVTKEDEKRMDLTETFEYIKETTIKAVKMSKEYCIKKKIYLDAEKLENDLNKLFEHIYEVVIDDK